MNYPSLQKIDKIRQQHLRPEVVGCVLYNKKLLFVYDQKHQLWQLPQGGINNKENIQEAIKREMQEELGESFSKKLKINSLVGDDKIIFPSSQTNTRHLQTDQGKDVAMKGKKYFFIAIDASQQNLDISNTEFDDYKWFSYDSAMLFTNIIYQKGKRRLTKNILETLRNKWLI